MLAHLGVKTKASPIKRERFSEEEASYLLFVWGTKYCKKLSPMAICSRGHTKEVGRHEAWIPQHMMCGIQEGAGGDSLGDNIGTKNKETLPKLIEQLKVKCLKQNVVIPQRSIQGFAGYDISVAYNCVILAQDKRVIQIRLKSHSLREYMPK